ncbi:MAG: hypothetical protein C0412_05740 [Flavobacterium sp.]|nr:hypothetical protein [Flavobacterium sp.]
MLVDDYSILRQAMHYLLERSDNIRVVCSVENSELISAKYFEFKPDIVIIDFEMLDEYGLDPVIELITLDKKAKILFLAKKYCEYNMCRIFKAGASGFVIKSTGEDEYIRIIEMIHNGKKCFMNRSDVELEQLAKDTGAVDKEIPCDVYGKLTAREKEILILIDSGLTSRQIAAELNIGIRSIEIYRSRIIKKYGLNRTNGINKLAMHVASIEKRKNKR